MKTHPSQNFHTASNFSAVILLIALATLVWLLPFSALWAQVTNDRILAPEVSHFTGIKEPGVDAHGDLHLSIPLMTVPGRDGLNFEIAAQYRSGIKVTQSASWIGLGWELDLGSVTRQALGGLDDEKHVDWARTLLDQMTSQPDVYSVNMNGNSTLLIATLLNTVPTPAFPYDPAKSETTGPCSGSDYKQKHFIPSPWRPWKICANGDTPVTKDGNTTSQDTTSKNDISYFNIATEDGSRYIYKLPTLASAKFPNEPGTLGDRYKFVSTWRLSAILSPNYSGPEIPDATSTGGWVKVTYRTWRKGVVSGQESELNAKEVATVNENELATDPIIAQLTYPYYVETPTHFAVFKTSKRYDRDLANLPTTAYDGPDTSFYSRKLGRIKLYKKTQYLGVPIITNGQPVENYGAPVMEVSFKYLKNGADSLQTYSSSIHGQMLSKLTLLEIAVKGRKAATRFPYPPISFLTGIIKICPRAGPLSWYDVTNNAAYGNNSLYYYQDDFGFLDIPSGTGYDPNESKGVAWSLEKIVYPEGGGHEIVYESDSLMVLNLSYASYNNGTQFCNSNVQDQFAKIRQGGPRVKTIRIYAMGQGSGSPPADSITFKYHNGRRSAIADVKFYKMLNYGISGGPLYFAGDRGQANIAYEWVEKKFMDQSRIRTFYRTTDGPEPQLLYFGTDANQKVIYSGNTRWNWGDITRVEYYSASSGYIKDETYHWFYRGHNADPSPIQLAKVAPKGAGLDCNSAVYLNFTYKRLDSLVTRHYFGTKTVTFREAYDYNDDGTFLKNKTETSGDGKKRKTEYLYAHEVSTSPPYAVMENRNMRSQMAQTTIGTGFIDEAFSSSVTTWKAAGSKYLPEKEFRLRDMIPSENPFINWSNPDTTLWIRSQTFSGYDPHGNPTRIHDAYGSEITISWDATATLIDSIKTRPNPTLKPLTTKYTYDPNTFRLTAITDPNGQKTEYKYDPLQRLIEMMTPDKRTAARHSYLYSRQAPGSNDNFVTTNPNHVRSVVSTHAEHVRNHDFENGSGAAPTSWIVTGAGSGVGTWDNTTAYSGARSLKADMPTPSGISYVLWKAAFNEKVSPKVAYRMEIWTKTANGYNGNARFILYFNAESKTITIPAGDRDWTKYTLDFIPLATTDYLYEVRLDFTSGGTYKGTVWYDRANFYKLNTTKTFADGLGRDIEAMSFEGNSRSIQTATYYDFASRVSKVTKPFLAPIRVLPSLYPAPPPSRLIPLVSGMAPTTRSIMTRSNMTSVTRRTTTPFPKPTTIPTRSTA